MFTSFNGEFTNETLGVKMIKCDHSRLNTMSARSTWSHLRLKDVIEPNSFINF